MLKSLILLPLILVLCAVSLVAQKAAANNIVFTDVKLLRHLEGSTEEISVTVTFMENIVHIQSKDGRFEKILNYSDINNSEYSYTKSPRWKTGLGLGAASILVPPLFLIAIPIGFTKHRRHWITIKTADDFVVLKIGKGTRKLFIPAFETKSGVTIQAMGEDK